MSPYHLHGFTQVFGGDVFVQMPEDVHGLAAGVADVIGGAKKSVGGRTKGIVLVFTDKK